MSLEYFQKIITNLDNIYSNKSNNQEIICTVNVNGSIYKGTYEPNCIDDESVFILNKGYILSSDNDIMCSDNYKAYININKIDAFTYLIKTNLPRL